MFSVYRLDHRLDHRLAHPVFNFELAGRLIKDGLKLREGLGLWVVFLNL